MNWRRAYLLLLLPLLVLDCLANVLLGGSFRSTVSASAHHARDHKYWHWTADVIDAVFFWQEGHCKAQADREQKHGSVWRAWAFSWISTFPATTPAE